MGLIRAAVGSIGGTLADQWKDFHTVVGAAPDTEDLASQASTEAQNGTRSSNLVTDCLLSKKFFEENFSLRGVDARHFCFKEGSIFGHLTYFKSTNGSICPSGGGIEKCIKGRGRRGEIGVGWEKNEHVVDDKLRHGTDAEEPNFFRFEMDALAVDLNGSMALRGDFNRNSKTFDFEIAIHAHAHEVGRCAGGECGVQEENEKNRLKHVRNSAHGCNAEEREFLC